MLAWILAGFIASAGSAAGRPKAAVEFASGAGSRYEIRGGFDVAVSLPTAWAVLTDYGHLPAFIGSMRQSRVLQYGADGLIVEQTSQAHAWIFHRQSHVV